MPVDTWSISSHYPAGRQSQRNPPRLAQWCRSHGPHLIRVKLHTKYGRAPTCHHAVILWVIMCLPRKTFWFTLTQMNNSLFSNPLAELMVWPVHRAREKAVNCGDSENMASKWGLSSGACTSTALTHKQTIQGMRSWRASGSLSLFVRGGRGIISNLAVFVFSSVCCTENISMFKTRMTCRSESLLVWQWPGTQLILVRRGQSLLPCIEYP